MRRPQPIAADGVTLHTRVLRGASISPNFFSLVAPNKGAKPFISRQLMVKRLSSTRALCTHVNNYISLVVL